MLPNQVRLLHIIRTAIMYKLQRERERGLYLDKLIGVPHVSSSSYDACLLG